MNNKIRKITLIVGKTGYGKSYFLKTKILPVLQRVIIFDIMNEYNEDNDFNAIGYIYINEIENFREYLSDNYDKEQLKVIITLDSHDEYEFALQLCNVLTNITVVIEEISNFSNAYGNNPELEKIIRFGRHRSLSIIGVTHRFSDLSLLLRNNLDNLIIFNLTAPNDIKYLSELYYIGDKACKIPQLKKRQFLTFENE
jgi:DNA helicase HerA-like ATPase